MKAVWIMGPPRSGKTAVALGLSLVLRERGWRVGYLKPVSEFPPERDPDARLMKAVLDLPFEAAELVPVSVGPTYLPAHDRLEGYAAGLSRAVHKAFEETGREADVLLVDGGGHPFVLASLGLDAPELARQLGAGVLLVTGVENDHSLDILIFYNCHLAARGVRVVGNVFNGVPRPLLAKTEGVYRRVLEGWGHRVLGVVPHHPEIGAPTVAEYYEVLGGELLAGEGHLDRPVEDVLVGAMTIESALGYFRRAANKAVVTGGDRAEIALAALETSTAVLILTGGLYPDVRVVSRADERGVPVILVHYDTYTTVEKLATVTRHLHPEDRRGIAIARENIERHCDLTALLEVLQP
ncbi:MAG: phosphotransacetylase family protein [Desulfotomaculales bacterium]